MYTDSFGYSQVFPCIALIIHTDKPCFMNHYNVQTTFALWQHSTCCGSTLKNPKLIAVWSIIFGFTLPDFNQRA